MNNIIQNLDKLQIITPFLSSQKNSISTLNSTSSPSSSISKEIVSTFLYFNQTDTPPLKRNVELFLAVEIVTFCIISAIGGCFIIFNFFWLNCLNFLQKCMKKINKRKTEKLLSIINCNFRFGHSAKSALNPNNNNSRMVLYLGLSDTFLALAAMYSQLNYLFFEKGLYDKKNLVSYYICLSQAYLVLLGQLIQMFITTLFAVNLLIRVILPMISLKYGLRIVKRMYIFEIVYIIISIGIPLITVTILLFIGDLGKAFYGCWLLGTSAVQFWIFYIPQFTMFFLSVFCYVTIIILIKCVQCKTKRISYTKVYKSNSKSSIKKLILQNKATIKFSSYLLIVFFLWSPATIGSIYNFLFPNHPIPFLFYIQTIWCLSGFLDSLVYGLNSGQIFTFFYTIFYPCCFPCYKQFKKMFKKNEKIMTIEDFAEEDDTIKDSESDLYSPFVTDALIDEIIEKDQFDEEEKRKILNSKNEIKFKNKSENVNVNESVNENDDLLSNVSKSLSINEDLKQENEFVNFNDILNGKGTSSDKEFEDEEDEDADGVEGTSFQSYFSPMSMIEFKDIQKIVKNNNNNNEN